MDHNIKLKYPRTPYLECTSSIQEGDRVIANIDNLINKEIIITEKIDGGNTCIYQGQIYARSTNEPTKHPSFDFVKTNYMWRFSAFEDLIFYCENMYAIHSIEYQNLYSYLYILGIRYEDIWLSWEDTSDISSYISMPIAPFISRRVFNSEEELYSFVLDELDKPSLLGGVREGIVIRNSNEFNYEDFDINVAKAVSNKFINKDQDWNKWKRASLGK